MYVSLIYVCLSIYLSIYLSTQVCIHMQSQAYWHDPCCSDHPHNQAAIDSYVFRLMQTLNIQADQQGKLLRLRRAGSSTAHLAAPFPPWHTSHRGSKSSLQRKQHAEEQHFPTIPCLRFDEESRLCQFFFLSLMRNQGCASFFS